MKNIPAMCVDEFYSDPDKIREFALSQTYYPSDTGNFPGSRTNGLQTLDEKLYKNFCNKLFSLFFDLEQTDVRYQVNTSFQLVQPMHLDPNSPKNLGWVHVDDNTIFAGVIFLTPDIDLNCGTSIFKLVDESKLDKSDSKSRFYKDGTDLHYDERLQMHRSAYVETIRFNNIYNRMICFDMESAHSVNNYYSSKEPRLTQAFFVEKIEADVYPPILRHKKYL
jgi:hypothetical protein